MWEFLPRVHPKGTCIELGVSSAWIGKKITSLFPLTSNWNLAFLLQWRQQASSLLWLCPQWKTQIFLYNMTADTEISRDLLQISLLFKNNSKLICCHLNSRWYSGKESACQRRRYKRQEFNPWVGKIPWRRKWQPTSIFLPGKYHGQKRMVGYSPWDWKQSDTTE